MKHHRDKYPSPGRCIYETAAHHPGKLTGEHIIPFGLRSDLEIWKASCPKCAAITGQLEQAFQRKMYGPLRTYLNMRSRKKALPKTISTAVVTCEGDTTIVTLPPEQHPFVVGFYNLNMPAAMTDAPDRPPPETVRFSLTFFRGVLETFEALKAHILTAPGMIHYPTVIRTIAKVAHAFAVAELGMEAFEPYLPQVILQESDDVEILYLGAKYIGGSPLNESGKLSKNLHELYVEGGNHNGELLVVVTVWLFSSITRVRYTAVVGKSNVPVISLRKKVVPNQ